MACILFSPKVNTTIDDTELLSVIKMVTQNFQLMKKWTCNSSKRDSCIYEIHLEETVNMDEFASIIKLRFMNAHVIEYNPN